MANKGLTMSHHYAFVEAIAGLFETCMKLFGPSSWVDAVNDSPKEPQPLRTDH